jgi:hypothetical protein
MHRRTVLGPQTNRGNAHNAVQAAAAAALVLPPSRHFHTNWAYALHTPTHATMADELDIPKARVKKVMKGTHAPLSLPHPPPPPSPLPPSTPALTITGHPLPLLSLSQPPERTCIAPTDPVVPWLLCGARCARGDVAGKAQTTLPYFPPSHLLLPRCRQWHHVFHNAENLAIHPPQPMRMSK